MSIPPIGPVATAPASLAPAGGASSAAAATSGGGFAAQLAQGLEGLQQLHANADNLAVKAATGSLTDAHDYMIASTEASLATELTVAVRNKALEAFTEIMRMQA
jgi:flagellar hook-basal body complex protein FliE